MGFNTTVLVLNDALGEIETDPDFGKKLASAIRNLHHRQQGIDVMVGCHVNAVTVIETHHADRLVVTAIGGNTHMVFGDGGFYRDSDITVLRNIADRMGYEVRRKPTRKTKE